MGNHGYYVRTVIEHIQEKVRTLGSPVVVDNKGTIEIINHQFEFHYNEPIDLLQIRNEMQKYYTEKNLDLAELEELEKGEYNKIYSTLMEKFKFFDEDIHSRRVLWTDDCCISMIQYLVRRGKIFCFVKFRSSDVVYKLFSDLYLIHAITGRLQDKLGIYNTTINVSANSFHEIVIKDFSKMKQN